MSLRYTLFFLACTILFSSSCNKCLKVYSKAVAYYDTGAQLRLLESGTTLEDQTLSIMVNESAIPADVKTDSADTYFRKTLQTAEQFDGCKTQLEQLNRYGNALTFQSLAAWQLRNYELARSSREQALMAFEADPVAHTREEKIMASLPALINLLQFQDTLDMMTAFANGPARQLVNASEEVRQENYNRIRTLYQMYVLDDGPGSPSVKRTQKTLLRHLENTSSDNESSRRVFAYALMRSLTQWTNANTQMDKIRRLLSITDPEEVNTISQEEAAFRDNLSEWLSLTDRILPLGAEDPVYQQWKSNMGRG